MTLSNWRFRSWADAADRWAIYTTHLGCVVRERVLTDRDGNVRLDVTLGGKLPVFELANDRDAGKTWR